MLPLLKTKWRNSGYPSVIHDYPNFHGSSQLWWGRILVHNLLVVAGKEKCYAQKTTRFCYELHKSGTLKYPPNSNRQKLLKTGKPEMKDNPPAKDYRAIVSREYEADTYAITVQVLCGIVASS